MAPSAGANGSTTASAWLPSETSAEEAAQRKFMFRSAGFSWYYSFYEAVNRCRQGFCHKLCSFPRSASSRLTWRAVARAPADHYQFLAFGELITRTILVRRDISDHTSTSSAQKIERNFACISARERNASFAHTSEIPFVSMHHPSQIRKA